jgi:putative ABC transport system permease protein
LYKGERQMSGIFNLFAGLALLISCLGLYGLSAYLAQQRTREIGVRKVLGAYHIRDNWWIFPIASIAALVVAWLTVSYESLKAAVANPARSLQSE